MTRRNWTREELLVALKLYCELEFGQFDQRNARVKEIAEVLDRTPSSIAMKLSNFASLDPAMNGKGLSGASKADAALMQEFLHSPEKVFLEVEEAYNRVGPKTKYGMSEESEPFVYNFEREVTERTANVKVRTVQDLFRRTVVASYDSQCAVCKIHVPELLVASHIVPWSEDVKKRANPTNGIALCGLHDKAFDRGYFSLSDSYSILIGKKLSSFVTNPYIKLMLSDFAQKKIHLPSRFMPDQSCLKWHRTRFGFEKAA